MATSTQGTSTCTLLARLRSFDRRVISLFLRYAHWLPRISLAVLFICFGLLEPLGHTTTTSILAHTIYRGEPDTIVPGTTIEDAGRFPGTAHEEQGARKPGGAPLWTRDADFEGLPGVRFQATA